ncbi:MAG: hypothetical protein ACREJQ_04775, partial [bacterium]
AIYAAVDLVHTPLGASPQKAGGPYLADDIPVKGAILYARLPPLDTTYHFGIYETALALLPLTHGFTLSVGYPRSASRPGWSMCQGGQGVAKPDCPLPYAVNLDDKLEVISVRPGDPYYSLHRQFMETGEIKRTAEQMIDQWPKDVLYWDGARWVNHYTLVNSPK